MKARKLAVLPALVFLMTGVHAQCEVGQVLPQGEGAPKRYGYDVAVDGDWAILGAPKSSIDGSYSGLAYVVGRTTTGWMHRQELDPNAYQAGGTFGDHVAISGEWLAVSAWQGIDYQSGMGIVHAYRLVGGVWEHYETVQPQAGTYYGAGFARSMDLDGDVIVVGATTYDNNSGRIYVFRWNGTTWVEEQILGSPVGSNGFFGRGVAVSGDWLVASADEGRTFIYRHMTQGWVLEAMHQEADAAAYDSAEVAIDGDTIALGFYTLDGVVPNGGAVDVLEFDGTMWQETQTLVAPDGTGVGVFSSVAVDRDRIVVGDFNADTALGEGPGRGAAYVFERDSSGAYPLVAKLKGSNVILGDVFGFAVDVDGDTIVAGAPTGILPYQAGSSYFFDFPQAVTPYGLCAAGAPCGNDDPVGGCANSTGSGAVLAACGSTSVAADDLVLTVTNAPAGQFGLVFVGLAPGDVPFGDGRLLLDDLGAGYARFSIQTSGSGGTYAQGPGIVAFSLGQFPPTYQISSGSTLVFQGWFRDPAGPCGGGFNFSNALAATFVN